MAEKCDYDLAELEHHNQVNNVEEQRRSAKIEKYSEAPSDTNGHGAKEPKENKVASHGKGPECDIRRVFHEIEEGLGIHKVRVCVRVRLVGRSLKAVFGKVAKSESPREDKDDGEEQGGGSVSEGNGLWCPTTSGYDATVEEAEDGEAEPSHGGEIGHYTWRSCIPEPEAQKGILW